MLITNSLPRRDPRSFLNVTIQEAMNSYSEAEIADAIVGTKPNRPASA